MIFYLLAAILLFSAVMVVSLKNIFHCALFLILALLSLSGIYYQLGAPFIAAIQLVIYVGAVMVLVIFAIMLTSRISDKILRASNQQVLPALAAILVILYFAFSALISTELPKNFGNAFDPIFDLGKELMTNYLFPFEIISIILLAALVGAITIARKD